MIANDIFKKVRKLEIRTKGLVNNLFGGEYQSAFKGRGMVFSEVREYQFGDDIRQIDWNVTARTGSPYIKVFEEEREQNLMLCVDISPSGIFGSGNQRKRDLAIELCAVLAFSAINNGDKVGMIMFSDQIEKTVPPRKGKLHALRLIRELYATKPVGTGTNLAEMLNYLNKLLKRRSIVVVASDFQDVNFDKQMKITNKKHDLVNIIIEDILENELPSLGIIPLKDAETGAVRWVDTSNSKVRSVYRERRIKRHQELLDHLMKLRVDTITVNTNESYVEPLMKFFERRVKRY